MVENELFACMMDDEFQKILQADTVLDELEKQKYNKQDEYFELMMILSKVFKIGQVYVSCITPAIWGYLYSIGNAYTVQGKQITNTDTDIFMYILHNGLKSLDSCFLDNAVGFCAKNNLSYHETRLDLKNMIYLSFRPLEMLNGYGEMNLKEQVRFCSDWITKLVSVIAPLTNKNSDDIMFNTSLTECFYYYIQYARKFDEKGLIKRRNTDQINQAIYLRTLQLGKQYYEANYKGK